MDLSTVLGPEAIRAGLKVSSKKRLLQELSELSADIYGLSQKVVLSATQAREQLGPTGMGGGVAIPHARLPELGHVIGLFVTLQTPVDFEALDGQPVDLVFMLLAPEAAGAEHLRALARISRTLRDPAICEKLRSTDNPAALFALLTEDQNSRAA